VHHEKQVYTAPVTTCKSERKEGPLAKSLAQRTGKGERSLWVNTRSSIMGKMSTGVKQITGLEQGMTLPLVPWYIRPEKAHSY
jgi:hypothetical protein